MQRGTRFVQAVVVASLLAVATLIADVCLPVVNTAFTVNGIVVGHSLAGGSPPGGCAADPGWAGVPANKLLAVNGAIDDTHKDRIFLAATAMGANIDKLYVAIHEENDDSFSANDGVVLYFDANNNATLDAADFALKIEIGPATPPVTEDCNKPVNQLSLYRYNAATSTWDIQGGLPTATSVTARTAFDYSGAPDLESGIWELELEIRPNELLGTSMSLAGFGFGAKLYVEEAANGTRVLAFPAGLTASDDPNANGPNDGAVTAAKLAKVNTTACSFDVQFTTSGISGTDKTGSNGKITRGYPNPIVGSTPDNQLNHFTANVQLVNTKDASDTSALAVPNSGNITYRLKPWNAGFTNDVLVATQPVQFTSVGQVKAVTVAWPVNEAAYAPLRGDFDVKNVNHVCLQVEINGFTVDIDQTNNMKQQNLTFTQLSTIRDRFLLGSERQEGPGGVNLYYLRARWADVPAAQIAPPGKRVNKLWSYRFLNAAALGLKDRGYGWYSLELKPNQQVAVDIEISGGPMPNPAQQFVLSPRAGGQAANPPSGDKPYIIPVKPGMIANVVADGLIAVDAARRRLPNGPDGFSEREYPGEFLLPPRSAYTGREHIGALIGSFDGFRTAFVIGESSSFMVPDKATELALAVNDIRGQFADNTGKGFNVTVVLGPPQFLPTRLMTPGNPNNGLPQDLELGGNLPKLNIDVMRADERRKFLRSAGYVSWAVYNSHP